MILEEIVFKKRRRLAEIKVLRPFRSIKKEALERAGSVNLRDFQSAIKRETPTKDILVSENFQRSSRGPIRFIGEIKVASPLKGVIRRDLDLLHISNIYNKKVDAISIITEEDFFKGSLSYLETVKTNVTRPVLRKDFIIEEYQIYESILAGADAILLIASILDEGQSKDFLELSRELGMSVLFEVHNEQELERALKIEAPIVGINNRDLKTMQIDLNTTLRLRAMIPKDRIVVSESGIKTREDVKRLEEAQVDAVLIGTVLMEAQDIESMIDRLRN